MEIYNAGLDVLYNWETDLTNFFWILMQSGAFNRDHGTVYVVTNAGVDEVSVSGYNRTQTSGNSRTVDNTSDIISYTTDNISMGTLGAGQNIVSILLAYDPDGDDSTAVPVGMETLGLPVATDYFSPTIINITNNLVASVSEA